MTSDALSQHSELGTFWSQTNRNYLFRISFEAGAQVSPLYRLEERLTVNHEAIGMTPAWRDFFILHNTYNNALSRN